jgi:iron complex transport system ATP-binding protein
MRTLAAMQAPLAGEIRLADAPLEGLSAREVARRVSVMLTDRVEAWNVSSYALVSLGRHPHTDWTGRLTAADHARIHWALEVVGAVALAPRPIGELSDGERQKVMLARALAQETPLVLLDEITAFLDLPRRVEIMGMLHRLARESRCALLLSTHDLDLALRTADSIWLLSGDGTMRVGAPEEIVLSGALEAAFAGNAVAFDPRSGLSRLGGRSRGEPAWSAMVSMPSGPPGRSSASRTSSWTMGNPCQSPSRSTRVHRLDGRFGPMDGPQHPLR